MTLETTTHAGGDAEPSSVPKPIGDNQLAAGVLAALGGVLLLRYGPVRSLLKLGVMGAAAWATYNHAEKSGWFEPAGTRPDREATPLAEASKRLADAWGAHYRSSAQEADGDAGARQDAAPAA